MMKKNNEEFLTYINELMLHPLVQGMNDVQQHVKGVSCLDHSILVSFISYKLATVFGGDTLAATRAGLLHDSFESHWSETETTFLQHLMTHPELAVKKASIFDLSEIEVEAIRTHMWPVTVTKIPKRREAIYVNLADKLSSIAEVTGLYFLLVKKYELKQLKEKSKLKISIA